MSSRKRYRTQQNPTPTTQQTEGPTPPTIKIPSAFKQYQDDLKGRKFHATKFYESEITTWLGIDDQLRGLAHNFGWENFLGQHQPTFEALTLEFLSTLKLSLISEEDASPEYSISFRMFNQPQEMTLSQLNEIFGWNPQNNIFEPKAHIIPGYNQRTFWEELSGIRAFDSKNSLASEIHHPAMRIFHRMLGYALFSKNDLGKLTGEELKCLYLAYHPDPNGARVNSGWLFIRRCRAIKEGKPRTGAIQLGGMISFIAAHLGFDKYFEKMSPVENNRTPFLDDGQLKTMHFHQNVVSPHHVSWWVRKEHHCYLPNHEYTRLDKPNPWLLPSEPLTDQDLAIYRRELPDAIPDPPPQAQSPPHFQAPHHDVGASSSEPVFNMEQAFNQMSLNQSAMFSMMQEMQRNQRNEMIRTNAIYHHHVSRGDFLPYVNYPNPDAQEGPAPGWNNRQPTLPYWPTRTESGYDYRQPGGCNPLGDPATPGEGWPEGYNGGWEPFAHRPFPIGAYVNAPRYDWPPHTDASGPDVDPTYNFGVPDFD